MSKVKWLDRELLRSPVYYCLCVDEEQYRQELKRLGIKWPDSFTINASGATTHFITNAKHGIAALVTINLSPKRTLIEHYALLTHEAVHIFQEICDRLGEKNPSSEFEAYGIQRISLNLMYQFNQYLKKQPEKFRDKLLRSVCKS